MVYLFHDEYAVQRVVQRCHNIVWERNGLDPAQAFDELSKILFVKLFAETTDQTALISPSILRNSTSVATNLRRLFAQATSTTPFSGIYNGEVDALRVDDLTLVEVLRLLSPYDLTHTTSLVSGADIKGTFYETVIGNYFRGKLGQFFTHRNLVEFMVRLFGVDAHSRILDPACGSAGFLVMAGRLRRQQLKNEGCGEDPRHVAADLYRYGRECLFGMEINERTVRAAKLNMLMHGLDHANIALTNALRLGESPELSNRFGEESFDLIFANPPFAGYEKAPEVLQSFLLGKNGAGSPTMVTREVLFLELIVRMLRNDGKAAIVVPQGILTNRKLAHVRHFLLRHTRVLAVIELPDWAFVPSGTSVRGSLLFIQKTASPPDDYPVFMKQVRHIGFTSTGRPSGENDLPETISEFHSQKESFMISRRDLTERLDAKFYVARTRGSESSSNQKSRTVALQDIGSFDVEKYNFSQSPDQEILLLETGDVDPETQTMRPKKISARECNYSALKVLRTGDIVISRRRPYRGAIVIVPEHLNGALAIPEFSVLRMKPGIDARYVVEVLRSKRFLDMMMVHATGEMSARISEKDLKSLRIPMPQNHKAIAEQFEGIRRRIARLSLEADKERAQINQLVDRIYNGDSAIGSTYG
jgi:type I restriction enzyme M protein